ncbi:hypothetical protein [uncultured Treponema sp.]|uniref:hypothetical protein n=1 Tax=uncultured Treponema sp. TaxID=162155 RepID=UPI0025FCF55A|nr:hypothetical protein [uncultured Treponema sp.]
MKKCLKTIMGAGLAAALVLSGCSEIADINEGDSNTTSGTFTILANSSKTVKVSKSSLTYNTNNYKQAFDLGGGADGVKPTYRAIKFGFS